MHQATGRAFEHLKRKCAEIFQPQNKHITLTTQMHNAALTTISPSMVTLGADMRRDIVRLGAIFPPPSAPPPLLRCFISTELPSTAPADFRQAQQFPILCLECTGLSGRCSFAAAAAMRRHAGSADADTGGIAIASVGRCFTAPRHAVFDLRSFRPIGAN